MDFTWLEYRMLHWFLASPAPFRRRSASDRSASQRRQMIYIKREIFAVCADQRRPLGAAIWTGNSTPLRWQELRLRSEQKVLTAAVDGGVFCLNCVRQAMVQF